MPITYVICLSSVCVNKCGPGPIQQSHQSRYTWRDVGVCGGVPILYHYSAHLNFDTGTVIFCHLLCTIIKAGGHDLADNILDPILDLKITFANTLSFYW